MEASKAKTESDNMMVKDEQNKYARPTMRFGDSSWRGVL